MKIAFLYGFLMVSALYTETVRSAAPDNDFFPGATPVSIDFGEQLDTTEATTDADDVQLNEFCGAPATDASVWYAYAPGIDGTVVVDVSQSDYSAGVLVGVGSQGNLDIVACGPGAVAFQGSVGSTYYALAIDDQSDGGGNGGSLSISFTEVETPVLEQLTVNPKGKFNTKTGAATISGTYACTGADFIELDVEASQNVGRLVTIRGFGFYFGTCDGSMQTWSAEVQPDSGKFRGGKSMTVTFSYVCNFVECSFGFAEQKVQLSGGK